MQLFGFDITRRKAISPVFDWRNGWRVISEPFSGAWQRNQSETAGAVISYPALYACLNRISPGVGKLPFQLRRADEQGIWQPVNNPDYSPVLRKPNNYQTAQQFRESWILSKLQHGNTYVLKGRDDRGVVNRLYILDASRVQPMVADNGDVYYQIHYSTSQNLLPENYPGELLMIPAYEIIHDRMNALHHPLIGVPPLAAAHWPAVKNLKILKNAAEFFGNGAQPGGILTAPAGMSETDANSLKTYWDENFTGENRGKVAVIGADMKYTSFAFKAVDSQMVEQMRYSDEQICQPFGVPPYKLGIGAIPGGLKVDDLNQLYYSDALQAHIESMEYLLDEGLGISPPLGVELDLEPLLRMDEGKRAEVESKLVGGKIKRPDEARRKFGLGPTAGGDTLWGQHQDYPLGVLRDRNDLEPVEPIVPEPEPEPEPVNTPEDEARMIALMLEKELAHVCYS